ncbi:transglutaminase-like domain-containing protein [Persicobacter psychrovividus]|uniref:Protein SirB1 N-terminal domain-containing protein n=1 Tax=Persicobacter psychrovividus TaxID=387638 RepID=A0ABM7VCB3_9BACT|nr:hypothetical protein PEPS_06520 [Persicobacter psychrovividus]
MVNEQEFKAMVSLLDDEDLTISGQISDKIMSMGTDVLPMLEQAWTDAPFDSPLQMRVGDILHQLQFIAVTEGMAAWKAGDQKDLLEGLYWIARYSYPDVVLEELRDDIDMIVRAVRHQFNPDGHPIKQVKAINEVLFDQMGFGPNSRNFHNPANSMINQVLNHKRGNPISLCAVYYLVAKKLGMPIAGVNLPNLFVLIYPHETTPFYINAFNKGLIFSKEDLQEYVRHLHIKIDPVYFEPCSHQAIIIRSLRNLIFSFKKLGDTERTNEVRSLLDIFVGN